LAKPIVESEAASSCSSKLTGKQCVKVANRAFFSVAQLPVELNLALAERVPLVAKLNATVGVRSLFNNAHQLYELISVSPRRLPLEHIIDAAECSFDVG
jgi:hypothetical protein